MDKMEVSRTRNLQNYVELEWEIEDFSKNKNDMCSKSFLLSDAKCQLRKRHYQESPNDSEWLSLYLEVIGPIKENLRVCFSMGIKRSDGTLFFSAKCEHECKSLSRHGWRKFIKCSKLFEMKDLLLEKDSLKIFFLGRLPEQPIGGTASQFVALEDFETLQDNLTHMYQNNTLCDVTIRLKDREFKAHQAILSVRSPVFAAMFKYDTLEKRSHVVDITDCDSNSFEQFLLYLYTGKTDKVASDNVFELYKTADKYDVKELSAKCIKFMVCNLTVDSFCKTFHTAEMYKQSELLESVTQFFIENVEAILPTPNWMLFIKDQPTFANELLMKASNRIVQQSKKRKDSISPSKIVERELKRVRHYLQPTVEEA